MWRNNLFLVTITLYISFSYGQPTYASDEHHWDLLIFTQQWPVTVCKEWKEKNQSHTCAMPSKRDSWSIHGIWPTKLGTMGPSFCNRSWHFDPEEIRPIETPLIQFWTNIEMETSLYSLWAHEWNKHGTCAAALEPFNSQVKYFSKGLDWIQNYTMTDILKEAAITPSNDKDYSLVDINNAVKVRLGVNPVIECRKEHGRSFIVEIRICFNKNLGLIDCDGVLGAEKLVIDGLTVLTNCDKTENILYPSDPLEDPPKSHYVQLYKLISWLQWFTL